MLREAMYYIFKNGRSEGEVGFLYEKFPNGKSNKNQKLGALLDAYTVEKGYALCEVYDRSL